MAFTSNWLTDEVCRQTKKQIGKLAEADFLKVTTINLSSNSLQGALPTEFEYLKELTSLNISSNTLNGSIAILGNCTKLQYLNISSNSFSGEIPPSIFTSELQEAYLNGNRLDSKLPDTVNLLQDGATLNISSNRIFGTLPIGLYDRLNMSIRKNQFVGIAPNSTTDMELNLFATGPNQRSLGLKKNTPLVYDVGDTINLDLYSYVLLMVGTSQDSEQVSRAVEFELYSDTEMIENNICVKPGSESLSYQLVGSRGSNTRFKIVTTVEGEEIPPIEPPPVEPPENSQLPFEENPVSDKISQILGKPLEEITMEDCESITNTFDLSNQNLVGMLPKEIGYLTKLKILKLHNNEQLTSLPSEIGNLKSLETLYFYNTSIEALPSEIGNLTNLVELYATSSKIKNIPHALENLVNLKSFNASENEITSVPNVFDKLIKLETLRLSYNKITDIPNSILNNPNITILDFGSNLLTKLPNIKNMTNLTSLALSYNQIDDELDSDFFSSTAFKEALLQSNKIGGVLPNLAEDKAISNISLHTNRIGGEVPITYQAISNLDLSYNQFIGTVNNPTSQSYDYNLLNGQIKISPLTLTNTDTITLEIGDKLNIDYIRSLMTINNNSLSEANELIITNLDSRYFNDELIALKSGDISLNFKLKLSTRNDSDNVNVNVFIKKKEESEEEIPPIEPDIPTTEEFKKKSKRENKRVRVLTFD